jgi:hypothetical protein
MTFLLALYFLPSIIALCRSHKDTAFIVGVNVLLGWTPMWFIAMLCALSQAKKPRQIMRYMPRYHSKIEQSPDGRKVRVSLGTKSNDVIIF